MTRSPIGFLKVFMSKIRLNGQGIAKNYMGFVLSHAGRRRDAGEQYAYFSVCPVY